jgi:predicted transposase/invertase (TIGR01784 family)
MKMAVGRLRQLSADERTRMLFEERQLYLMDEAARLEAAKAEGLAEGKAEGKTEGKWETAKRMFLRGFEIETISQLSGLSVEDVEKLK